MTNIIITMVKIVFAIVIGYFLYKIHILNDNTNSVLSKLIIYGCGPCMIFASVVQLDSDNKDEIITLIIAGFVLYILLAVLVYLFTKMLHPGKELEGVYQVVLMIGNAAFLAFPIGEALMGDVGVSYLAILNVHSNLFAFSYGIFLLTRKNENGKFSFSFKKLLNPGIIGAIVAIILFFIGVTIPEVILEPIEFVGDMTSPLAMIVMGSTIATYSLKELFNNWRYYILALLKLIIIPIIILFIAKAVWGDSNLTYVFVLHVCMPTATIVSMIALANNADYKTASSVTGLMNILCIVTIPLMWLFANAVV